MEKTKYIMVGSDKGYEEKECIIRQSSGAGVLLQMGQTGLISRNLEGCDDSIFMCDGKATRSLL